jgi:glycerol-3-phosphate dehydrogenase (NAD+)
MGPQHVPSCIWLFAQALGWRFTLLDFVLILSQAGSPKTFSVLEAELLNGQKLQGTLTSNEVQEILVARGWEAEYPLFTTISRIINDKLNVKYIVNFKVRYRFIRRM